MTVAIRQRWESERTSINTLAVARELFGQDPAKTSGGRAWWLCPFHQDHNPSLSVETRLGGRWKCWSCGVGGDAADLVERFQNCNFIEARAQLLGLSVFNPKENHAQHQALREASQAPARQPAQPTRPRITTDEAEGFHEASQAALRGNRGRIAQAMLAARGLTEETVALARLGYVDSGDERIPWRASGVLIPWYWYGNLAALNLRVDDAFLKRCAERAHTRTPGSSEGKTPRTPPRYLEVWRHPNYAKRGNVYPDPASIQPGQPVILVEGELDRALVAQEVASLGCNVLTAGATSHWCAHTPPNSPKKAKRVILRLLEESQPWLVGLDNDEAGETVAEVYMRGMRYATRVLPPEGKDWTEAAQRGVDLQSFFAEELNFAMTLDRHI